MSGAWYDGLTFEQVLARLYEVKGEALSVPYGFGEWMADRTESRATDAWNFAFEGPSRAELWRRLFQQLDRIEAGQGPRTLVSGGPVRHETSHSSSLDCVVIPSHMDEEPEPTRTWQSALRQLADTLIPGNTLQLDPSDPEAACATIIEAIQSQSPKGESS